jgi:hypothetical protein
VLKPYLQIDVSDNTRQDYLTVGLAPDYNNLGRKSIKMLDDNLKVMIAGTVKAIAMIPLSKRSWDRIVSAMMQCPLIEPAGVAVQRTDSLVKSGTDVVKFDGSPILPLSERCVATPGRLFSSSTVHQNQSLGPRMLWLTLCRRSNLGSPSSSTTWMF